jgi:hypothetical protein
MKVRALLVLVSMLVLGYAIHLRIDYGTAGVWALATVPAMLYLLWFVTGIDKYIDEKKRSR